MAGHPDPLGIETLHHVTLTVTDLDRSRRFYTEVLGLEETPRPARFDFPGAWLQLGDRQLHLVVHPAATFRGEKGVDSRDVHFAIRVRSYDRALAHLRAKGFREDAPPLDPMRMKASRTPNAGFPQIFIMDPDRHVIEINAGN